MSVILACLLVVKTVEVLKEADLQRREEGKHVEQLNEQAHSTKTKYDETCSILKTAETEYEKLQLKGKQMTTLVFNQCDVNLYDTVYPLLDKSHLNAVFVITPEKMPGKNGCINSEQYAELRTRGWTYAVGAPPRGTDFEAYLTKIQNEISLAQLQLTDVFYFPIGTFEPQRIETVQKMGYTAVFYCCEEFPTDDPLFDAVQENLVLIPYMYTSKSSPIWAQYDVMMRSGNNCSISTGNVVDITQFVPVDRLHLDTSVIELMDIVQTITVEFPYYKSLDRYRSEFIKSRNEYALEKEACATKIAQLAEQKNNLFQQITKIYLKAEDEENGKKRAGNCTE